MSPTSLQGRHIRRAAIDELALSSPETPIDAVPAGWSSRTGRRAAAHRAEQQAPVHPAESAAGSAAEPTSEAAPLDPPQPPVGAGATGTEAPEAEAPVPASAGPTGTNVRARMIRSTAIMASGSTISRVLGFVRNYLFGMVFAGSSTIAASAFNAANVLPDSIWILVGGGVLNAILVPAIVRATKQEDRGSDFVSRLMTLVMLVTVGLTILCMIAVPLLLMISNGNLPQQSYVLAIQMALFLLPQIILSALYVMAGQLLNAHDSFGPYEWAPVMNNIVGCVVAGGFLLMWGSAPNAEDWTLTKLIVLSVMNVGGSVAQVAWLWWFVRKLGLKLRPKWGFRGLGLGKLSGLALWTLGMVALGQVGVFATRWATGRASAAIETFSKAHRPDLAAAFPGLTSLGWAYLVFMIPQGVIGVTLVTTSFPAIARHARDEEHSQALARYASTQRMLLTPMMLATAVFTALAVPVMWVIGGGTGPIAATGNGIVLVAYMVGLVPMSAMYLVKRVFYAYEDARAALYMQIPTTLVPLVAFVPILLWVDPHWAAFAAALSASLGNIAGWILGLWLLDRHARRTGVHGSTAGRTASTFGRLAIAMLASLAVGAVFWWLLRDVFFIHRLVAVALSCVDGVLMVALFGGIAAALRVEEVTSAIGAVRRRLVRRRPA